MKTVLTYHRLERHIREILQFWKPAIDWKGGGIHYRMKDLGEGPDRRPEKCLLMHCRQLYDFSVGFEHGFPGARGMARHLLVSLDDLFLNRLGFYDSFTAENRWFPMNQVSAYNQYYTVVGLSRYSRAFEDREVYGKAERLFFKVKQRFTGSAEFGDSGAYSLLDKETGKISWKSGNALLHLYEALVNLALAARKVFCCDSLTAAMKRLMPVFEECYRLITRRIYDRSSNTTLEDFDDRMRMSPEQRYGSVTNAHALEWIGFMIEAAWITGRKEPWLGTDGRRLLDASVKRAVTADGAFRNDYYLRERRSTEGVPFWAQVESTLTACLAARWYGSSGYLALARKLAGFYFRYFVDREFGGLYSEVSAGGIAIDRRKGHMYKCDHHNLRMCEKILSYGLLDR